VSNLDEPLITRVDLRNKIERPQMFGTMTPVNRLPLQLQRHEVVDNSTSKPSIFVIVRHLYTIIKGLLMKDWKTTVSGIVAAVAYGVHAIWGFYIPEIVTNSVISLALFAIGYFSADKSTNK
jgi:Na+-translocating ferredoxin:NAD+ oxidoreductase RnfE subunit